MNKRIIVNYYGNQINYNVDSTINSLIKIKLLIQDNLSIKIDYQKLEYNQYYLERFFQGHIFTIVIQLKLSISSFITCDQSLFSNEHNKVYSKTSPKSGYFKFAINIGKHGDNGWLRKGSPSEWILTTYHGTSLSNAISIAKNGYNLSLCKTPGIYSTTCFKTAEGHSTKHQSGHSVVIMNRIYPNSSSSGGNGIFINNDQSLIRPYAIIIKLI